MSSEQEEKEVEEVEESTAETEGLEEEDMSAVLANLMEAQKEPRVVGVFGDIDEERSSNTCAALITFHKMSDQPIEIFISTNGGSADDMYAIVDTIRYLKSQDCEVHIMGIGKVMSAGVLILASGTKGNRKIGKNTRLMLHSLQGGTAGAFPNMKADIAMMQKMQNMYINSLAETTSLSYRELKKIVSRRTDTYLTAEDALEMGIVDEIL
jgi:ATP-dependent Clp protease protease subunit